MAPATPNSIGSVTAGASAVAGSVAAGAARAAGSVASSFETAMTSALQESRSITFSGHARERLATRQFQLSEGDVQRIAEGVDRAAAKGSRESLVLLNELALIVNVPNRTVLTALDSQRLREGVVTNIDSTVFV